LTSYHSKPIISSKAKSKTVEMARNVAMVCKE
jgi:hypothetical protein